MGREASGLARSRAVRSSSAAMSWYVSWNNNLKIRYIVEGRPAECQQATRYRLRWGLSGARKGFRTKVRDDMSRGFRRRYSV